MAKPKKVAHIVQFKLDASPEALKEVDVRFSFLRQLYNATLGELFRSLSALRADSEWQQAIADYRIARKADDKKQIARLRATLKALDKKHNFTESHTHSKVKQHVASCCFKDHLDSHTTQKIATRAFKAMNEYRFGKRGKPRFKSWKNGIHSAEGKAKTCLRIIAGNGEQPTRVEWNGQGIERLVLPVVIDRKDTDGYQAAALDLIGKGQWKYCRIVKKTIRNKARLFAQVVVSGTAFVKARHRKAWEKGRGKRVGLDIGPSTIAAVSEQKSLLQTICPRIDELSKAIKKLQKQNSHRLRLLNPTCFTKQTKRRGRKHVTTFKVKKGARFNNISAKYLAVKAEIKELHRKLAACRSQAHSELAVLLISMGNNVLTESISYKAWQKMFGRSVGAYAPSELISKIKHKAEKTGGELVEINTWKAKLSQYDHVLDECHKKPLKQRVHWVGGETPIQRDIYSAFLAMCINDNKDSVSRRKASALFNGAEFRHKLIEAGIQVISSASTVALPQSLGISQLKQANAQLEQYA